MNDISIDEEIRKIAPKVIREFFKEYGTWTKNGPAAYFKETKEYARLNEKYTQTNIEDIFKPISEGIAVK